MKAVEFETIMNQGGQIVLPAEFLGDIPEGKHLKVLLTWDAEPEDSAWRSAGRLRFEEAYCDGDDVYEQLLNEAPVR